MKTLYIKDAKLALKRKEVVKDLVLHCWLKARRHFGKIIFIEVIDSTGNIQISVDKSVVSEKDFKLITKVPLESSLKIKCQVSFRKERKKLELLLSSAELIGEASLQVSPQPRTSFNIFDEKFISQVLSKRHIYIRNEQLASILKFRHLLVGEIHRWFRKEGFIQIDAPILTALPLYDNNSVIKVNLPGDPVYLTQCVAFYLESAMYAFEKVYNIGPSFRGEESRSKRHLMEYWHIKGEVAFANLEDGIVIVEKLMKDVVSFSQDSCRDLAHTIGKLVSIEALNTPYPRISYREAVKMLDDNGHKFSFGRSLNSLEESLLSEKFSSPFWIVGIPRSLEPFPYVINQDDREVTNVADLIAPRGFGELLGVAEKIYKNGELIERMKEKGKDKEGKYNWLKELSLYGSIPHVGFGMGLERLIRYILNLDHIRDAIPFPRVFRRRVYP